jgi:hypothetical protein
MRLNAKINDDTDLVNKQYILDVLSKLNTEELQTLREAIEALEDNTQWGYFEE